MTIELQKVYRCDMCDHILKVTPELKLTSLHLTPDSRHILCPECISKNKDVDISLMEPYIKMRVLALDLES